MFKDPEALEIFKDPECDSRIMPLTGSIFVFFDLRYIFGT